MIALLLLSLAGASPLPSSGLTLFRVEPASLLRVATVEASALSLAAPVVPFPPATPATTCPDDPSSSGQPVEVGLSGLPIDRHDRLTYYISLQLGGAAMDLWSTGYCLSHNPQCREANPLGQTAEQRIALKIGWVGVFGLAANWLERSGHRWIARILTGVTVAYQVALSINNFHQAGKATP